MSAQEPASIGSSLVSDHDVVAVLRRLHHVLYAPVDAMAGRLSALLAPWVPHLALVTWSESCGPAPLHAHGDATILAGLRTPDLAGLADALEGRAAEQRELLLAGIRRPVLAVAAPGHGGCTLLVLVLRPERESAEGAGALVEAVWALVKGQLAARVHEGHPDDLSASRAAASERTRVAARFGEDHAAHLATMLEVLRESTLGDRAARQVATDLASHALVDLRRGVLAERELGHEPVDEAFAHLGRELEPLLRHGSAQVSFSPPRTSASIPAQAAQGARAITRSAVLALLEQGGLRRLRIDWQLGDALEVTVRDDGPGGVNAEALSRLEVLAQVEAADATIEFESVPEWGTRVFVRLPLGLSAPVAEDPLGVLQPREREVLDLLTRGHRNREIADALFISQNTVKFHIGNILRKLGVESRGQAAALARGDSPAASGGSHRSKGA